MPPPIAQTTKNTANTPPRDEGLDQTSELKLPKYSTLPTPVADPHLPYLKAPEAGIKASNNKSPFPIIMENGMNMKPDSIEQMAQIVANRFGREVLVIPNHTDGIVGDLQNCVASAFSERAGMRVEKRAAANLAQSLVARLSDTAPVEIEGYSQGTLITQDVLSEMRRQLVAKGDKKTWDSFASRIELRTHGAAMHLWPPGVAVKEQRHLGDFVAVVGDIVSANQRLRSIFNGEFSSNSASVVTLPVFRDAHSIVKYCDNGPAFYLKSLAPLSHEKQATTIIESMKRSEFSDREYSRICQMLCADSANPSSRAREHNRAVIVARFLVRGLLANPDANAVLSQEAAIKLAETSVLSLRKEPEHSALDHKIYPGRTRNSSR